MTIETFNRRLTQNVIIWERHKRLCTPCLRFDEDRVSDAQPCSIGLVIFRTLLRTLQERVVRNPDTLLNVIDMT
jgi:hypothetical protein